MLKINYLEMLVSQREMHEAAYNEISDPNMAEYHLILSRLYDMASVAVATGTISKLMEALGTYRDSQYEEYKKRMRPYLEDRAHMGEILEQHRRNKETKPPIAL